MNSVAFRTAWRWLVGGMEPSWNQQIQALKTDAPLRLPAIKPLKARRKKRGIRREMEPTLFRKRRA